MAARFQVETVGLVVAFIAAVIVLGAWGLSGFAIEQGNYDNEPAVSSHKEWFGCYKVDGLRIIVNKDGLSIPGSGISFDGATAASDKRGPFIYFETPIDFIKSHNGNWRVFKDERYQMNQKLYVSGSGLSRFITIPGGDFSGTRLYLSTSC